MAEHITVIYFSDEYTMGGDPLYRPALYRIVGNLPVSEHEVSFATRFHFRLS